MIRLASTSLAWSADSDLMNFTDPALVQAFEAVDDLRNAFRVNNPHASVADIERHLRGEAEHCVCYGGYHRAYIDGNFDRSLARARQDAMCPVGGHARTASQSE